MLKSQSPENKDLAAKTPALTHIRSAGFVANLEGYAYQVEEVNGRLNATLWYASLVKDQTTVNAIWASLVKEPPLPVVLYHQDQEGRITGEVMATFAPSTRSGGSSSHQVILRRSGAVQKILLPQCARAIAKRKRRESKEQPGPGNNEFVLLLPPAGPRRVIPEPQRLYYERLKEATTEPLHSDWTGWLWQRGLNNREIAPLEFAGLTAAFHCRLPDEQEFSAELETAIRQGILGVGEMQQSLAS